VPGQFSRFRPRTPPPNRDQEDRDAQATRYFDAFVEDARKRQLSSSENLDKTILTYSSGGLALSLTFLKDFVPIREATAGWLLYWSWGLFILATALTTFSFWASYQAQTKSIQYAEQYYKYGKPEYQDKQSFYNRITKYINAVSGLAFIAALIFTFFFVFFNLDKATHMSGKNTFTQDGLPSAEMLKVSSTTGTPLTKGLPAATMPSVPSGSQTPTGQSPQATPSNNVPKSGTGQSSK
jgi:hypothetical protein